MKISTPANEFAADRARAADYLAAARDTAWRLVRRCYG